MYHTSFHACILPNCLHTHICTYTVCVCVCDMFLVVYHLCIQCVYVYDLKVELCTLLFPDSLVLWASTYMYILFICCPTCHVHESYVNCCLCYIITYTFSHSLSLSLSLSVSISLSLSLSLSFCLPLSVSLHLSPFLSLPLSFLSVKVNNKGYCIRS